MPNLMQEQFDACPYRSLVAEHDRAHVARVWLLTNDATPDAIPPVLVIEVVRLVLAKVIDQF